MSHSTLGAQLAALSSIGGGGALGHTSSGGGSYHPGVILPANKRHGDEAIGRGYTYSALQGFNLQGSHQQRSKVKFKASLIHETARDAADVPLSVLRETAVHAVEELQQKIPHSQILQDILDTLILEVSGSSQGKTSAPKLIPLALTLFSTLLIEDDDVNGGHDENEDSPGTSSSVATVHVLEFMIRRYDLHIYFSNEFLWTFLPHMDNNNNSINNSTGNYSKNTSRGSKPQNRTLSWMFRRCLELIDLTGTSGNNIHQSYLWLRPYVAAPLEEHKGSDGGYAIAIPPRSLLARHVITNLHLLRTACSMTMTVGTVLYTDECTTGDENWKSRTSMKSSYQDTSRDSVREGIAHTLSFTAALLLEGLGMLQTGAVAGRTATASAEERQQHMEAVLRTLLPVVSCAVSGNHGVNNYHDESSSETDHTRARKKRSSPLPNSKRIVCSHFTAWGYLVASAIGEAMDLAVSTVDFLCQRIYAGAMMARTNAMLVSPRDDWSKKRKTNGHDGENGAYDIAYGADDDSDDHSFLGLQQNQQCDALATILSLLLGMMPSHQLQQHPQHHQLPSDSDFSTVVGIPLLNGKLLGCILPNQLWTCMVKDLHIHQEFHARHWEDNLLESGSHSWWVATCLGHLSEKCHVIVEPFVAAIIYRSMFDPSMYHAIRSLLLESSLRSIYVENFRLDLTASLASHLITLCSSEISDSHSNHVKNNCANDKKSATFIDLRHAKNVLKLLHHLDSTSCERGVAYAIHAQVIKTNTADATDATDGGDIVFQDQLKELLNGVVLLADVSCQHTNNSQNSTQDNDISHDKMEGELRQVLALSSTSSFSSMSAYEEDVMWKVLPIQVAIDHTDSAVRAHAIRRMVQHIVKTNNNSDEQNVGASDFPVAGEAKSKSAHLLRLQTATVLERLMRKWGNDPDINVGIAVTTSLSQLFDAGFFSDGDEVITAQNASWIGEMAIRGCYRAIEFFTSKTTTTSTSTNQLQYTEFLGSSIRSMGYISHRIAKLGLPNLLNIWQVCVEVIVSQLLQLVSIVPNTKIDINQKDITLVQSAAASALGIAFGQTTLVETQNDVNVDSTTAKQSIIAAIDLLRQQISFISRMKDNFSNVIIGVDASANNREVTELSLRMRCFCVIIQTIMNRPLSLSPAKQVMDVETVSPATTVVPSYLYDFCVRALSSTMFTTYFDNYGGSILLNELKSTLFKCIQTSIQQHPIHCSDVPNQLLQLMSVESERTYNGVIVPILNTILDGVTPRNDKLTKVSPYVVLMEAALRVEATTNCKIRLVERVSDLVRSTTVSSQVNGNNNLCQEICLTIVPGLALLDDNVNGVRRATVDLFETIHKVITHAQVDSNATSWFVKTLSHRIMQMKSSILVGGTAVLSNFLVEFCNSNEISAIDGSMLKETLISLCVWSATSCFKIPPTSLPFMVDNISPSSCWLPHRDSLGGTRAAVKVLNASETSGEASFPLLLRWNHGGKPILDMTLSTDQDVYGGSLSSDILECSVRMMKGVIVSNPQKLIICSGPQSTGGRARSYSIGKMDGLAMISPYPRTMCDIIVQILTRVKQTTLAISTKTSMDVLKILSRFVARDILSSKSWGDEVFRNLSKDIRKRLAVCIIQYMTTDSSDTPEYLSDNLPFDTSDIVELLKNSQLTLDVAQEFILIEFVHANSTRLLSASQAPDHVKEIIDTLFDHLELLSTNTKNYDSEASAYLQSLIITTLIQFYSDPFESVRGKVAKPDNPSRFIPILLTIISGRVENVGQSRNADIVLDPIHVRARSGSMSLLLALCSHFPKLVVSHIIPALMSYIQNTGDIETNQNFQVLCMVIPVFWKHASTVGLSLTDILLPLITVTTDDATKSHTTQASHFRMLVKAITTDSNSTLSVEQQLVKSACVGSVLAMYLSYKVQQNGGQVPPKAYITSCAEALHDVSSNKLMASLLLQLYYIKGLFHLTHSTEYPNDLNDIFTVDSKLIPTPKDIAMIATGNDLKNSSTSFDGAALLSVIQSLLEVFNGCLMLGRVKMLVTVSESSLPLQLWQELLVAQSAARFTQDHPENFSNYQSTLSLLDESIEYLQSILPAQMFLSSVSLLIEDDECRNDLRSRALRLVAEKVSLSGDTSSEITLFVDFIPTVLKQLEKPLTTAEDDMILQQSCLVVVEQIARAYKNDKQNITDSHRKMVSQNFTSSLTVCASLLQKFVALIGLDLAINNAANQLVSSTALCIATLVRVIGANSVQFLPILVQPLILALENSNRSLRDVGDVTYSGSIIESLQFIQLSVIRALSSILECMPQFMTPYISKLLTNNCMLSNTLRSDSIEECDVPIHSALNRFDDMFSSKIPFRLLVSPVTQSIQKCSDFTELKGLLLLLKASVKKSDSTDVSVHRTLILNSILKAVDLDLDWSERAIILENAVNMFYELVLKVSEIQLRRLYTILKEWRGDYSSFKPDHSTFKRYAFWLFSARLSKELRSIFLPCLDTSFKDVVKELEYAVSMFSKEHGKISTLSQDQKRRRVVVEDAITPSVESMRILLPVLLCLEESLRTDWKEGLNWVCSDNRYDRLLTPLGKLLVCHFPDEFPLPEEDTKVSSYQFVVEGIGLPSGSVIGCICALARAAGDEQLWKPLNHAVLKACGDESRSECRRAGLICLDTLMRNLGEEYMVLLPEILPILAESLEDTNDEVAGIAKDILNYAEELTGEDLGEALR